MRTETYFARKSLSLRFYDAITALDPGINGDVAFYAQGLKPGDAVMDLGCGTGRVTLGLAELDLKATGVDISERMVAMARQAATARGAEVAARANFVVADAASVSLPGRYARTLAPFYILNLLPTRALRAAAVKAAARHLATGGLFVAHTLPIERLKKIGRPTHLGFGPDIVASVGEGGKLVQHVVYRHRGPNGAVQDETLERLEFGWIEDREMTLAGEKAGLKLVETRRGFGASPQDGAERVYVFHKPG